MFADPAALREACEEYFEWNENNPLYEEKIGFSEGCAVRAHMAKVRAMTIKGLTLYLDIAEKTYYEWKKTRDDLADVLEWAEKIIWSQKFGAAAAGLLNANIISRELGLADKTEHAGAAPILIINPPAGEAPPEPPIHGEGEDDANGG